MPGRTFSSPADFNAQLGDRPLRANARRVRTIKARPIDLIQVDRAKMLASPPVPLHLGGANGSASGATTTSAWTPATTPWTQPRPGRMIDVSADLDRVRFRASTAVWSPTMPGSGLASDHNDRPGPPSRLARLLRERFRELRGGADSPDDLARDLADYDRAFGLTNEDGEVA